jgi:SAM-dependent methyltransferase
VDSMAGAPVEAHDDNPFVCPDCLEPLVFSRSLVCPGCGKGFLERDGVVAFNPNGMYHGPILARADMAEMLSVARRRGYRYVLQEHLPAKDADFARYISAKERRGGLALLTLRGDERILDFGCAFGVLSLELVSRAALVAALDVTREKIEFLEIVKQQEGLTRLFPLCNGNPLKLPFHESFFDWVILNAVFEYLPASVGIADVYEAHLAILKQIYRVLKPGGRIYLATKNRYGYQLLLGERDHGGLRFTSVLPRAAANWLMKRVKGTAYRIVTHSFDGYRRLLSDAGFAGGEFYWVLPSLQYPDRFVPLVGSRRQLLARVGEIKKGARPAALFWRAAALIGILPQLVPHYAIVGTK